MLFSRDLLFIHVPKTGGMVVTEYLLRTLPRPVHYSHPHDPQHGGDPGIEEIPGSRHETLGEARRILSERGIRVHDLPLIIAVVRNPYDLEVSRYAYLQRGEPWDWGREQSLALSESFDV